MSEVMDRPRQRNRLFRYRKWLVGALAAVVLAVSGLIVLDSARSGARVASNMLTIVPLERGVYHDFVPLRGKVVPNDTIYVDAISGGRVERVLVQAGDQVVAGQPLIEFSNTALQLQIIQQESQLNQAITQLQSNEIVLEQNRFNNEHALEDLNYQIIRDTRSFKRRDDLVKHNATALEARDLVSDQLDYELRLLPLRKKTNEVQEVIRTHQLPLIHEQLDQLQKNLLTVRSKLDELTVTAPVAGQVTEIGLKVGESRKEGDRLAVITPATGMKISSNVDEYYLRRVHNNLVADLNLGGRSWKLKVSRVYPQVKDGTFTVDLAFEDTLPSGLLPGQAVQGRLALGDDTPGDILKSGPFLEQTGGDWVFVVAEDGRSAKRQHIKIGRRNAEQLEVLEGLSLGQRVIVSDYTGFDKTDRIEIEN